MKKALIILLLTVMLFSLSSCSALIRWQWKLKGVSEEGRRETFEKTKSYNESKEQDLLRYRLEYLQTEDSRERQAIRSTIQIMFADYDESMLRPELREFLEEMRY